MRKLEKEEIGGKKQRIQNQHLSFCLKIKVSQLIKYLLHLSSSSVFCAQFFT